MLDLIKIGALTLLLILFSGGDAHANNITFKIAVRNIGDTRSIPKGTDIVVKEVCVSGHRYIVTLTNKGKGNYWSATTIPSTDTKLCK